MVARLSDRHAWGNAGAALFLLWSHEILPGRIDALSVGWSRTASAALSVCVVLVAYWANSRANSKEATRIALTAILRTIYEGLQPTEQDEARLMVFVANRKESKIWQVARFEGGREVTPRKKCWSFGRGMAGASMSGKQEFVIPDVTKGGGSMEAILKRWGFSDEDYQTTRCRNRYCYIVEPVYREGENRAHACILVDAARKNAFERRHAKTIKKHISAVDWVLRKERNDA